MNPQPINADDYRTFMQSAAFAYLERHRDQYLAGDDQLFTACVQHLVNSMDVPVFLSQALCQRAWNDLFPCFKPIWVGVDMAAGDSQSCLLSAELPRYP